MFINQVYRLQMFYNSNLKIILISHLFNTANPVNNYFIIINLIKIMDLIKLINPNKYVQMVIYT